jgi:hypothetical protein
MTVSWITALVLSVLVSSGCMGARPTASSPQAASEGAVGMPAPSFRLRTSDGVIRSRDVVGTKPVLLYFSMGPG